jgi:hypothetical protein
MECPCEVSEVRVPRRRCTQTALEGRVRRDTSQDQYVVARAEPAPVEDIHFHARDSTLGPRGAAHVVLSAAGLTVGLLEERERPGTPSASMAWPFGKVTEDMPLRRMPVVVTSASTCSR